jgi:hypothetical protein
MSDIIGWIIGVAVYIGLMILLFGWITNNEVK